MVGFKYSTLIFAFFSLFLFSYCQLMNIMRIFLPPMLAFKPYRLLLHFFRGCSRIENRHLSHSLQITVHHFALVLCNVITRFTSPFTIVCYYFASNTQFLQKKYRNKGKHYTFSHKVTFFIIFICVDRNVHLEPFSLIL